MSKKKLEETIMDANFYVTPTDDFVGRVMRRVTPARWGWLRPYALALPLFVAVVAVTPMTRNAILDRMYPERAVASSVQRDLDTIRTMLENLDAIQE